MLVLYGSITLCFVQAAGLKYQFGDFTISYIDSVTFHNYLFNMMISDDINQRDSSESNRKNIAISKQSFFSVNPVFLVNKNFFLLINMLITITKIISAHSIMLL